MVNQDGSLGECRDCGTSVTSGVAVVLQSGTDRETLVLCEDCAQLGCTNCGTSLPLDRLLDDDYRRSASAQTIECSRCGETVTLDHAVELRNDRDVQYRKRICGDCLKEVAVPPGYRVVRDLSPEEV